MDKFLERVERRAYRMAYIATGHQEDALDIVQDAMCKLVQKYANRNEAEWGPLFHRIVQSTIRDWYRRQRVRRQWRSLIGVNTTGNHSDTDTGGMTYTEIEPIDSMTSNTAREPVAELITDQAISALDAALHKLSLRQQQAFLLRIWEGLNVAQTADAMSCSQGSVKTHLSRALQALCDHLQEYRL